jgi:hypothetical protein
MTARLKHRTQFLVVVDFAIERNPYGAVFIGHRLMSRAQIHDGQAAMPQPNCAVKPDSCIVRPAMCERIAHRHEMRLVHAPIQSSWNGYAADSTHNVFL